VADNELSKSLVAMAILGKMYVVRACEESPHEYNNERPIVAFANKDDAERMAVAAQTYASACPVRGDDHTGSGILARMKYLQQNPHDPGETANLFWVEEVILAKDI
jgi:hypothetical protein